MTAQNPTHFLSHLHVYASQNYCDYIYFPSHDSPHCDYLWMELKTIEIVCFSSPDVQGKPKQRTKPYRYLSLLHIKSGNGPWVNGILEHFIDVRISWLTPDLGCDLFLILILHRLVMHNNFLSGNHCGHQVGHYAPTMYLTFPSIRIFGFVRCVVGVQNYVGMICFIFYITSTRRNRKEDTLLQILIRCSIALSVSFLIYSLPH